MLMRRPSKCFDSGDVVIGGGVVTRSFTDSVSTSSPVLEDGVWGWHGRCQDGVRNINTGCSSIRTICMQAGNDCVGEDVDGQEAPDNNCR